MPSLISRSVSVHMYRLPAAFHHQATPQQPRTNKKMAELFVSLGAKDVRLVAPADASFSELCNSYTGVKESANPSVVAVPDSAEQVQTIVQ